MYLTLKNKTTELKFHDTWCMELFFAERSPSTEWDGSNPISEYKVPVLALYELKKEIQPFIGKLRSLCSGEITKHVRDRLFLIIYEIYNDNDIGFEELEESLAILDFYDHFTDLTSDQITMQIQLEIE